MATAASVLVNQLESAAAQIQTVPFLPGEDPAAFGALLQSLETEHRPATPTERFLVHELASAQWKIARVNCIEAEILDPGTAGTPWAAAAARFLDGCPAGQALLRLGRLEQAARRAWHQALAQLMKLRKFRGSAEAGRARKENREALIKAFVEAPVALRAPEEPHREAKPMPAHLKREMDNHKRRDPLFDPQHDRSQMSKELQKYLAAAGTA